MNLRALLFDLDGVIADTLTLHFHSWKRLGDEEQIPFTWNDFSRSLGLTRQQALIVFLNGRVVSEETAQAYLHRKNAFFHELLHNLSPASVFPGVAELIREGRAAGLKIGLGSSSQNAKLVLSKLGLLDSFDVVGDGNTVTRHKPEPDIYLWAAERMGVSPSETIVFEDSPAGMRAGLVGGFYVVGIGAQTQAAHLNVPTLAGMSLTTLREQLQAKL